MIMVDDTVKSVQLAFRDGEDWKLQTKYLQCWRTSKGSKTTKSKVNPQLELKSTVAKTIDLTIEEAVDDMKLSLW